MTMLGANGMDEKAEHKAVLVLEGNQLGLLKLENPQIGKTITVCAELSIESISAYKDEAGVPHPRVCFEVASIMREEEEDPMASIKAMYPGMA